MTTLPLWRSPHSADTAAVKHAHAALARLTKETESHRHSPAPLPRPSRALEAAAASAMGSLRPRAKETPLDVAWRYRSVAALISVPVRLQRFLRNSVSRLTPCFRPKVLLIATVALLMPRGPAPGGFHDAVAPARRAGAGGGDGRRYAVVIDAGSTGSRVHAFSFRSAPGGALELLDDAFTQLKPGLSSYAASPGEGGASLRPLLDAAAAAVPAAAAPDTPLLVRATAGLRLLPGTQAEQLLEGAWPPNAAALFHSPKSEPQPRCHAPPPHRVRPPRRLTPPPTPAPQRCARCCASTPSRRPARAPWR